MNSRSRQSARLSAAIAAAFVCAGIGRTAVAQTRALVWDIDGGTAGAQDGSGGWDTSTPTWLYDDGVNPPSNVAWNNANPDSATFGNATNAFVGAATPNNIDLAAPLTVQDLTFGTASNGAIYNISDFSGGSLTVNGNITKVSGGGQSQLLLVSNALTLGAGNHVVAMKDSPGDIAELSVNGAITGAGGLTIDNSSVSTEAWGTLALNVDSTYTGATNINMGRLVISTAGGLGATSAGTTVSNQGALSIGGAGSIISGGLTISEPITITRDTYTGGEFGRYTAALIVANNGLSGPQTHTISGPLVLDSADARIQVNTNALVISSNITHGTNGAAGTLSLDGDFAGFVTLTGNNTGIGTGGIKLLGGMELNVSNENNLGGPTAPITFAGSATLHPVGGFMTSFGSHPINNSTFSGGLDIDAGQTFTVDQNLGDSVNAVGSIGKRGLGTLNLGMVGGATTINLRGGQTFWDAGIVNVNVPVTLHSLHLRSSVVNIGTGGSVTTTTGFNSFGQDSTGTNGGPDIATVNLTGTGQLIQTNGSDFNISDGANTQGTINVHDTAVLTTAGITFLGKSTNAVGTINQDGGTVNINRNGNFALVLGDGRSSNGPTGNYNLSGASSVLNVAGEMYVGEGANGIGHFTMTGGTVNLNNWFVVGRENALGTVDISGGVFNKTGGGNVPLGESGKANTFTLRGTGQFLVNGEIWFANGGGHALTANIQDNAVLTNNNWFVVGRGGAQGTLDISGSASVTKSGGGNAFVGESTNAVTSTMTVRNSAVFNDTGGEFWVGQAGGIGILSVQDSASFTTNNWLAVGRANANSKGTINLSGGTLTKQGTNFLAIGSGGQGTLNQTGGTLNSNGTRLGEASDGTANLSGGAAIFTGEFHLGHNGGVFGTLNVSNTANVTVPDVVFGNNAGTGGGTINLDGGTLTANSFAGGAGTGAKVFNFNGGTLKAGADSATFMGGLTAANVKSGGAIIDSNNHSVTISQSLLAGTPSGGLTKQGLGTLTLAGANTYTGGTTVSAGTLVLGNADATAGGSIAVANGTLAQAQAGLPKAVTVSTLNTNTSGKFDLTNNSMVVKGMSDTQVKAEIVKAYNAGAWNGAGGLTSSTAAAAVTGTTGIGYAVNSDLGTLTTFKGVTGLTATDVLVKYTYFGDADLDGDVDGNDVGNWAGNFTGSGGSTTKTWFQGDWDYDGDVDGNDVGLWAGNFTGSGGGMLNLPNAQPGAVAALEAMGFTVVPEPTGLALLGTAGVGLLAGRRRRSSRRVG